MSKQPPTDDTPIRLTEELAEAMEKAEQALERRLQDCPYDWRSALIDVLDTYEVCGLKLLSMQGFVYAKDAVALTQLVMEKKARDEDRADAAEKARMQEGDQ